MWDWVKIAHLVIVITKILVFLWRGKKGGGAGRIKSWRRHLATRSLIIRHHSLDTPNILLCTLYVHILEQKKVCQQMCVLFMSLCCMCWTTLPLETTQRHTRNPAGLMSIGHILEERKTQFFRFSSKIISVCVKLTSLNLMSLRLVPCFYSVTWLNDPLTGQPKSDAKQKSSGLS